MGRNLPETYLQILWNTLQVRTRGIGKGTTEAEDGLILLVPVDLNHNLTVVFSADVYPPVLVGQSRRLFHHTFAKVVGRVSGQHTRSSLAGGLDLVAGLASRAHAREVVITVLDIFA